MKIDRIRVAFLNKNMTSILQGDSELKFILIMVQVRIRLI